MVEATFEIMNIKGLHARASAKLVETVEQYDAEVTVSKDGMDVNGDSIMGLLMLAASIGTHIKVKAVGPDEEKTLDALGKLIADKFGEGS